MRKLMALLAICVVAASTPSWALFGLGDVKFDGSLEVSGNSANNETDFGGTNGTTGTNDHRGRTATRVRVGMNAMVTEGVTSRLELIRDTRQYGDSNGPSSLNDEQDMFLFHNAYIDITDIWGMNARLGRQYVGNPGDLVWNISPTDDDSLTNNSIDGLLLQCRKWDFINIDVFTGKLNEDDAIANTDKDDVAGAGTSGGDLNLSSLDIVFPKVIPGGKINAGYLLGDDNNSNLENDNNRLRTARVGVNGGVSENMLTYRAEVFSNMGEFQGMGLQADGVTPTKLKYQGSAIDLGVGINSPETSVGTFGGWINWLMASGDDNVTDDKDKSFHDFSVMGANTSDRLLGEIFGKSNTLAGGNAPLGRGINTAQSAAVAAAAPGTTTQGQGLNVINLGVNFKPTFCKKSTFRLDYYIFSRAEDEVKTSVVAGAAKTKVGDKFGNEIDLAYMYDHSANVGVELGYAMLNPDDALTGNANPALTLKNNDDAVTKLYARLKVKWGGDAQ